MNLNQLKTFHQVAVSGSFTGAAESLHVTQPAVTSQVKALEVHYEVELFYRRSRTIELTQTGRDLLAITERLFGLETQADSLLSRASKALSGSLRIGADSPFQVVSLVQKFQEAYPGVRLQVSFGNSQDIAAGLRDFQTDVGLMAHSKLDPRFFTLLRREEELVVFVPCAHPWARRKVIPMASFHGAALIRREDGSNTQKAFDLACSIAGVEPRSVVEIGSREGLREAVASGMGIGVIASSELGYDPRWVRIPIVGESLVVEEFIVCLRKRRNAPLIASFVDMASRAPAGARP
jgi:LysR family transcriptional regulator, low CO2-responsive transcriptional regulator